MPKVNMFHRDRVRVENLKVSETFKLVGKDDCFQVIDLMKVDGFTESPTLRDDVLYCVNIENGIVTIVPKTIEVERVRLNINEGILECHG